MNALAGILRAKARAEGEFDMAIGLIAITSRSLGPELLRPHRGLGDSAQGPDPWR